MNRKFQPIPARLLSPEPAPAPGTLTAPAAVSLGSSPRARIGAVAFIHRFGSSLNEHVRFACLGLRFAPSNFHCCILDGVFEPASDTNDTSAAAGVVFHAACGLDAQALAAVQGRVRRRILRAFVRRGLIEPGDADQMGAWEHGGGFSIDASVRIEDPDRPGLERLLRYCARPPFALEHLQQLDAEHLVYHGPKPRPEAPGTLVLTPLEFIDAPKEVPLGDKIAALVPPPRAHRHRYYGVLAPNASLRVAVTALAPVAVPPSPSPADAAQTQEEPPHRAAARYLWAMLLARI